MLGVVGDLGSKRVMAWEISSELDVDTFLKEINSLGFSFTVAESTNWTFFFSSLPYSFYCRDGFVYVDLFSNYVDTVPKVDFFKHFKRTY